jgi:hypothetical protein
MLIESQHASVAVSVEGEPMRVDFVAEGNGLFVADVENEAVANKLLSLPGYEDVTDRVLSVEERATRQQAKLVERAARLRAKVIVTIIDEGMSAEAARMAAAATEDAVLAGEDDAGAMQSGVRAAAEMQASQQEVSAESKPPSRSRRRGKPAASEPVDTRTDETASVPDE